MFLVDVDSIIQSVNIVFIIILLGTALIGFLRGTIKAGFNIVSTILFLVFGFIFMTPISKSLAEMNIESFGIVFDDILVKTPMQLVETIIYRDYPQFAFLFEEGTYSYDLIQSVIGMGIKLVYFVLMIVIMFTIYELIVFIIWLIVRKPLRKLFIKEYDISLKHKVRFKSRLGFVNVPCYGYRKNLSSICYTVNTTPKVLDSVLVYKYWIENLACKDSIFARFTVRQLGSMSYSRIRELPLDDQKKIFVVMGTMLKSLPETKGMGYYERLLCHAIKAKDFDKWRFLCKYCFV